MHFEGENFLVLNYGSQLFGDLLNMDLVLQAADR